MSRKAKLGVETLESRITPTGNLTVAKVSVGFPNGTVPGAKYTVSILLNNPSNDPVKGISDVTVDMVDVNTLADVGTIKELPVKINLPQCAMTMAMPPGKEKINFRTTVNQEFALPVLDLSFPNKFKPGMYKIKVTFGQVATESGVHTALSDPFDYEYQFGNVKLAPDLTMHRKMTIKGPDGIATFGIDGNGVGTGTFTPLVGLAAADLALAGTDAGSSVTETGDGVVHLRDIDAPNLLKSVKMPDVSVDRLASFDGGLGNLSLDSLGTGSAKAGVLIAAGAGKPATLTITSVNHADITAGDGINLLLTRQWTSPANSPSPDVVTAPFIKTILDGPTDPLLFAGDFAASLHITGDDGGVGLKKAAIAGMVSGLWQFDSATAAVKDIYAGSAIGWHLTALGNVEKLTIGSDFLDAANTGKGVKAGTIGNMLVVGKLASDGIEATGATKNDIGINSIKAGSNLGPITADTGGIQTIDVSAWGSLNSITAKWIKTLRTAPASAVPIRLNLSGTRPGAGYSLDSAEINGDLGGGWAVSGRINSITAKSASDWTLTNATLGTLKINGAMNSCNIDVGSIDSLSAVQYLNSTINVQKDISSFVVAVNPDVSSSTYMATNVTAGGTIDSVVLHDVNTTTTACHIKAKEIVNYNRWTGKDHTITNADYSFATPAQYLDSVGQYSVEIG